MTFVGVTRRALRLSLGAVRLGPDPPRWSSPRSTTQEDWIGGRLALYWAYALHFGTPPRLPLADLVAHKGNGRPFLVAARALFCSLAHSHGWAIGGISGAPIGVDIERIRNHHPSLLAYVAEAPEIAQLSSYAPDRSRLVTMIWTIKEAVMKATGRGLTLPPRRVRIEQFDGSSAHVVAVASGLRHKEWRVILCQRRPFYVAMADRGASDELPRICWIDPGGVSAARDTVAC